MYNIIEAYDGDFFPRGYKNTLEDAKMVAMMLCNNYKNRYPQHLVLSEGERVISLYTQGRPIYRVYIAED